MKTRTRLAALALVTSLGSGLAGCGLTGELQRPDPIFGEPDDSPAGQLPNRQVERGLPDAGGVLGEDDDDRDAGSSAPSADDELLGGPGGF